MSGPGGTVQAPNNTNPVESVNMASLLARLAQNLPGWQFGLEVIVVTVTQRPDVEEP